MDTITYTDALQAAYESLNTTEKAIADRLLNHDCSHLSARELAQDCGCSAATVVRFSRKLGYEGFADLRRSIRLSRQLTEDITLFGGEKAASIKRKSLLYATSSLRSTVQMVDDGLLEQAARCLLSAGRVQLCAMGSAAGVALSACSQFLSFGIRADFPMDELQQMRSAACLKPGDVLIGINYNNAARCVADAFWTAKQAGATTVLITAEQTGVLSRYADLVFFTPTRKPGNALNFSTTTMCQAMVIQLLLLRLWQLDPERIRRESARLQGYTKMKLYDPATSSLDISYTTRQ